MFLMCTCCSGTLVRCCRPDKAVTLCWLVGGRRVFALPKKRTNLALSGGLGLIMCFIRSSRMRGVPRYVCVHIYTHTNTTKKTWSDVMKWVQETLFRVVSSWRLERESTRAKTFGVDNILLTTISSARIRPKITAPAVSTISLHHLKWKSTAQAKNNPLPIRPYRRREQAHFPKGTSLLIIYDKASVPGSRVSLWDALQICDVFFCRAKKEREQWDSFFFLLLASLFCSKKELISPFRADQRTVQMSS